ncbi:ARM repeat-containing protein [Amylocystis lapponica]|nr:ARM repeat-containing protein [Amylocystis lapponica]
MEGVERLVRTWMATERDEEVEAIVSDITNGNTTLLQIVKALGEYLTAEEDNLRNKGVECLTLVLGRCPPEKLNRQSVRVLVTFYCGKLEDTETIIPALRGLASLVSQPLFTSSDAVEVMKALITHVKMKALVQSQRLVVFTIVDTLIARQRDALKGMGNDFLSGYISLAEGEKDPRNLLLAFAIARVLLMSSRFQVTLKYVHLPCMQFSLLIAPQDLFNITFCYFPITFRPPPDDPYGITTDDLKNGLLACLNATPAFGALAIPLFMEKLTAGTPPTKRDTLRALDVCLPVYGAAVASEHARKMWNTLKLEIFQPTDNATEEAALKTIQILIQTLYSADAGKTEKEDVEGLAKDACEECIRILREPEKSQAKPAIKVLCAFMSTTPSVASFTLSRAVPHLVKLFLNPDEASNRAPVLSLLSDLIAAARDSTSRDPEVLPTEGDVPLSPFKDEVLGVLTVGLKTTPSAASALDGLKGMITTAGLLTDEELGFVVHNVNELLQREEVEGDNASDLALDLLTTVSASAPRHISQTTLPLLFSALPDRPPPREADSERLKYWRTLASLKRLCKQPELFETLVVRLSTKVDLICVPPSAEGGDGEPDIEPAAAYAHSVLHTIADVLAAKVELGHTDVAKYIDRLVPSVYNLFIYSALSSDGKHMVATDQRLVSVAAHIVTLIVQTLSPQRQEAFVAALFSGYLHDDLKQLADGQQRVSADSKFDPLSPGASTVQKNLLALFSAAVVALHKEVPLPVADEVEFLDMLLKWTSTHADNVLQRDAITHAISSILNKRAEGLALFLSEKLGAFWTLHIADGAVPAAKRRQAIISWTWITRALLVRNHPVAMSHTDRLFELFLDAEVGWDAAKAVGSIPATDKVLTKKNHAIVKILHAQRFCSAILPRIIAGARSPAEQGQQNAYLVALTSLIKSVPKSTYAHEMSTLMPLLLRGLDLPDTEIRANVMDTLLAAAESNSKENTVVSEHSASLVATMLKNSKVQETQSVRVRVAALRYLAKLPSIVRYDVLHPQKATVLRELAQVLDDPKKAVRREAVEAR